MERAYQILKVNLKHNLIPHMLILILFFAVAPFFISTSNLNTIDSANVLEVYISLFGIVLLVPVFIPDLDLSIRHLLVSKKESVLKVHLLRALEQIVLLVLFVLAFMEIMKIGNCQFDFLKYFYGTMANCLFLGGLGVLAFSLYNSLPFAYMVPMFYYMVSMFNDKELLGNFYLFTMTHGSFYEKNYIFAAGAVMIAVGILYRKFVANKI